MREAAASPRFETKANLIIDADRHEGRRAVGRDHDAQAVRQGCVLHGNMKSRHLSFSILHRTSTRLVPLSRSKVPLHASSLFLVHFFLLRARSSSRNVAAGFVESTRPASRESDA